MINTFDIKNWVCECGRKQKKDTPWYVLDAEVYKCNKCFKKTSFNKIFQNEDLDLNYLRRLLSNEVDKNWKPSVYPRVQAAIKQHNSGMRMNISGGMRSLYPLEEIRKIKEQIVNNSKDKGYSKTNTNYNNTYNTKPESIWETLKPFVYFIVVCWIIGGLWRAFDDSPNYGTPYPGSDRDNPMNEGR